MERSMNNQSIFFQNEVINELTNTLKIMNPSFRFLNTNMLVE